MATTVISRSRACLTASARSSGAYCRLTLIKTSLIAINFGNRDVYENLAGPVLPRAGLCRHLRPQRTGRLRPRFQGCVALVACCLQIQVVGQGLLIQVLKGAGLRRLL